MRSLVAEVSCAQEHAVLDLVFDDQVPAFGVRRNHIRRLQGPSIVLMEDKAAALGDGSAGIERSRTVVDVRQTAGRRQQNALYEWLRVRGVIVRYGH